MSDHESAQQPDPPAAIRAADPPLAWGAALPRLWILRSVGAVRGGGSWPAILGLATATFAFWVAIDWWEIGPEPLVAGGDVPLFAWYALAVLAVAGLLCWRSRPAPAFRGACTLVMGLVPVVVIAVSVAALYVSPPWLDAAGAVLGLYALLFLARGMCALTGTPQTPAALTAALFLCAFIWLSDALGVIPDVWAPAEAQPTASAADAPGADSAVDAEALLFEQPARIDRALDAIHRDAGAKPNAFFVGFAGVGEEKEFAGEIGLAGRVLAERYRAGDRRLALINDRRDLERGPLASVSGLKYALRGLAARMQLDRDVLFLSISSHGGRDATIAVSNADLPLDDLTDEELADALNDSGIKWRVIIISACYAGAFIDSLRDPGTIVIAAAAADRTSFGCSNDRDLTYFGEAFYRDSLPTAVSLRAAFDAAKAAIAVRERREGVTASLPQAYFGADLEAKLKADLEPVK